MELKFSKRGICSVRAYAAVGLAAALLLGAGSRVSPAQAASTILPNLVADPPDTQSIATDTSTGTPRLLLRFNGYIHNKGPGAVDFRGSREAPKVSKKTTEEVEKAREKEESLPQKTEEELATPPMKTFQRLFTTNSEEKNIERAHVDEASSGELIYSSADGHHHWHLQKIAKYSLWNGSKTAEVAPAQKVGFCLDDSQHVETSIGPSSAVYSDSVAPFREFCERYRPNATSLFEGISVGWRDVYDSSLAFQWVDLSNVLPGEYWLREDVNPLGFVKETGGENVPVYSTTATIVPGFDAQPQAVETQAGVAKTVTLSSKAFKDSSKPTYKIVSGPAHGTLGSVNSEGKVAYTPTAGWSGPDSFTFSAADASSKFPEHPAVATVSIEVTSSTQPAVSIEGAPASMPVSSSVQLSAKVVNDSPEVTWGASAGTITTAGRYTAPETVPAGGTVTVTATTSKGAKDSKTIEITPAGGSKGLLAGDATATYTVSDQTTAGREEAFQFVAKSTGKVEELLFRTNATANTGLTGLVLAVFAENGGKPGAVLGSATASGTPAVSSWIKVSGLSVAVTSGTKYWLVALPLGSGKLHFNAAVASGGAGNVESTAGGLGAATQESSWETFNQGPVGFQANGTVGEGTPSVTIEGAPASMTTGSSAQLTAKVTNDSPEVTWGASAGSITSAGRYTAPETVPAGGKVTVTATTSKGAKAEKTIEITAPVPSVTIEGAPASMTTGSSAQLTAKVTNDSPEVTWGASAGSITSAGRYTAPETVPAGGKVTVTATTSKGAKAEKTIEITAAGGTPALLVGDATATYTVSDQTTTGREEAFQFTAKSSGTVEELLFRTGATANTGVTGVVLAVFAENAGKPGEVLGSGTASGTPAASAWIKATGLSVPVVSGTKYWLVELPLGSGKLHFNASKGAGAGTGNVESTAGGMTKATAQTSWESYGQGPAGFQANGATSGSAAATRAALAAGPATAAGPAAAAPLGRIAVAGAPQVVTAGTSVQLSALADGASGGRGVGPVTWSASGGEIGPSGLYTAPRVSAPTAVTISANARGAHGQTMRLEVDPVPAAAAAPSASTLAATGLGTRTQALGALAAMLFNRELVVTTAAGQAGLVTIVAHANGQLLGGCSEPTPAGVGVTCRLSLHGARRNADIAVTARLLRGHRVLGVRHVSGVALPTMRMAALLPATTGPTQSALSFMCSPALRTGGPGAIS
jgi:Lysyl oxidase/Bacterial Ig domain